MSRIKATTYVICPIGTPIEHNTNVRPKVGEVFEIRHIDTGKVVQRAKVVGFDDLSRKTPQPLKVFHVRSVIIAIVN